MSAAKRVPLAAGSRLGSQQARQLLLQHMLHCRAPEGDISVVLSIYNSYCVSNGFDVTAAPAAAAATPTQGST